jgi:uncharacterized membrane protein
VAQHRPAELERARRRARHAREALDHRNPNWSAQLIVGGAILLGLALPAELRIGNRWLIPACEAVLLAGLIAWTPNSPSREDPRRRLLRLALISVVSAVNVVALFLLMQDLLAGGKADGRSLLVGGAVLWLTSVLLFAVWFWEVDRGGPVRRLVGDDGEADFLFPQMEQAGDGWEPTMGDYLYLSLTNAASFTPAEAYPLTGSAKLALSIQTVASLATTTVVLAYAINSLN